MREFDGKIVNGDRVQIIDMQYHILYEYTQDAYFDTQYVSEGEVVVIDGKPMVVFELFIDYENKKVIAIDNFTTLEINTENEEVYYLNY